MKTKISKILGVALTVALIATLFAFAAPASAIEGEQTWTAQTLPTALYNKMALGTEIAEFAISSDGMTIYAIDNAVNLSAAGALYKSLDGGVTWAAMPAIGGGAIPITNVAVAPDDPNAVAVAGGSNTSDTDEIWMSNNGGTTWAQVPAPNNQATGMRIMDLKVAPARIGTLFPHEYLIATADNRAAVTLGSLQIIGQGATWTDIQTVGTYDFTSCELSPGYAGDRVALGVATIVAGTTTLRTYNTQTPALITADALATLTSDYATAGTGIVASDISLPTDYDVTVPGYQRAYASLADGTTATLGDIFRADATGAAVDLGLNLSVGSIAYSGTGAEGKLIAGEYNTNMVWRTTNPMGIPPVLWSPATTPPSGENKTVVAMHPAHVINHISYAGTSGTDSGFFISRDNADTFWLSGEPGTVVTAVGYKFAPPEIKKIKIPTSEDGEFEIFDQVLITGLYNFGEPGEPVLPYETGRVLIPPGHELVSVSVEVGEKISLAGEYLIEPGQVPIPASSDEFTYTPPNPEIYQSRNPFPEVPYQVISVQSFRGYQILLVNLVSIEYIPLDRKISYFESMTVSVKTAPVAERSPFYRGTSADESRVEAMVDNPESLGESLKGLPTDAPAPAALPAGDYDMVIVTNSALTPTFQSYADWRTNMRGIRTIVYDIATVLATYSGYDDAEKLRNFIIDAYSTWGIDYVLLGGDVEIIPYRFLYCTASSYTENIPADIYYAGLDGTWDSDGDHVYGEKSPTDEADLLAEVYVGRAPVNTVSEAQNVCNKIRSYEESNLGTYRCDWLFFTTELSSITFGGDYKDDAETSELHPPHGFNITKVYQYLGGTKAQIIAALNAGQRVGNSCGHGNYTGFGMLNRTDVDNLTNSEYCLIYTWACLTNKFEETDAISEHFLYKSHGAFAYIGNSRYGWYYNTGDASGPSHDFELEFYNALLYEEIPRVGPAMQDSKEEFSGSTSGCKRWIYYALNLMGDPATLLRIKNDLWIKTSGSDDGSTPVSYQWTSPDIAVDQPHNGWQTPSPFIVHENPEYGSVNRVYVRVRNLGCEASDNVTVNAYWADPSGGIPWPDDWYSIGSATGLSIPAGGEEILYFDWTPAGTAIGHRCLLATAECDSDPISIHNPKYDNNVAQRNVHIVDLHSSYHTEFVLNPLSQSGKRNLTVTLLDAPRGATARLKIPETVQFERLYEPSWLPSCSCSCPKDPRWDIIVTSTAVVSGFTCGQKEIVDLEISVPSAVETAGEFTLRITEELDGETIGGIDYIVSY
jgi:hypothetical protein